MDKPHPPSEPETNFSVPEVPDNLSSWIHSMYVVTFDIEYGQAIENQIPQNVKELEVTEVEKNNICYSSFPDSNSSILGSAQYHFRMRLSRLDNKLKKYYSYYNSQTTQALNVDTQFIHGYVYFLQKKDTTLKRGYFQKSLVILSLFPFTELFYHIVNVIGSNYFETEQLLDLENVYNQTKLWQSAVTGTLLNLTMMGSNIAFYIPNKDDKLNSLHANLSPTSSLGNKMIKTIMNRNNLSDPNWPNPKYGNSEQQSSFDSRQQHIQASSIHGTSVTLNSRHEVYHTILTAFDLDLYNCFQPVISDLQTLWEMIMTCEPFIVIAHKPDLCANFVQALIGLIYPFKSNLDYRPFFTIHDPEFKEYSGYKGAKPSVILGVTNPFFTKSLEHWPNVIQLCSLTSSNSSDQLSSLISSFSSLNTNINDRNPSSSQAMNPNQTHSKIPFVDRLRFTSSESLRPGLNSKYKPFLNKDKNFLTKILRSNKTHGSNRPNNVQTALIRRWLIELTQSFFMPLERYLTQMMPLHNKISAFKAPPELPIFDFESFLSTLDTSGPQLTTKIRGDWPGLYRKFFRCPNFYSWYSERKSEIDKKLWILHMESFLEVELPQAINSQNEVEAIDMIIRIRHRLNEAISKSHEYQFTSSNLDSFEKKLAQMIEALPIDVRPLFTKNQITSK